MSVKLGVTYSRDSNADRVAISTAPHGAKFVDENKNVWERNHDVPGGWKQTVGRTVIIPPTLLKAVAVPGQEPVAGGE